MVYSKKSILSQLEICLIMYVIKRNCKKSRIYIFINNSMFFLMLDTT